MPHELTAAFEDAGLVLNKKLVEMLDEHSIHRTERRGCGFTQATRFLSDLINLPYHIISAQDLSLLADVNRTEVETVAQAAVNLGWSSGWRSLQNAPADIRESLVHEFRSAEWLSDLDSKIQAIRNQIQFEESLIFFRLMTGVLARDSADLPSVQGMTVKPDIGSCSQAEEFFLEIAHGKVRRGGAVNIVIADDGKPVMLEKMNLGESHSAIVLHPVQIFGVAIPPGSLCALEYDEDISGQKTRHGQVISLEKLRCARFLRLTTLSVSPDIRLRAFSRQLETQVRMPMLSPKTTTMDQLQSLALDELKVG